jgi:hypothetical protein
MNERVADPTDLIGMVGISRERSVGAMGSHAPRAEETEVQKQLLDCVAVPLECSRKLRIQFRQGARLQPLPYPLDEENP